MHLDLVVLKEVNLLLSSQRSRQGVYSVCYHMSFDCVMYPDQVLTTGYWPAYPAMEVAMPDELQEHVECFR